MPTAWYMNTSDVDPSEENFTDPPVFLSMSAVQQKSGVENFEVDVSDLESNEEFKKFRESNGYNFQDIIEISKDKMPDYEDKLKIFYKEHLHADDEVRLFLEGSGYFDVRDVDDKWIRIKASKGDLLVLPAGIYHRFALDKMNYAKVLRLFAGTPVWTAINRPADDHPVREKYLATLNEDVKCHC